LGGTMRRIWQSPASRHFSAVWCGRFARGRNLAARFGLLNPTLRRDDAGICQSPANLGEREADLANPASMGVSIKDSH
ncbi:hypothetical protein QUF72_17185, partial [Desulfobacterales bacterium HSG2]|nr:hypothetical protein [Desulfobacterales bacterium HSG2]